MGNYGATDETQHAIHSFPSKIDVDMVENKQIEAFLALALKLPLDDFKPMFYRLFNLAVVSVKYITSAGFQVWGRGFFRFLRELYI